jgi:hypothetical protein
LVAAAAGQQTTAAVELSETASEPESRSAALKNRLEIFDVPGVLEAGETDSEPRPGFDLDGV